MTTIRTDFEEGRLYLKYPGQTNAQDVVMDVYADGRLEVHTNGEIGNAVPANVWHGIVRRFHLGAYVTKKQVRDWISEHRGKLVVLVNGMDERWDGNNIVGTLTNEAKAAEEDLAYALDSDPINYR